MAVFVAADLDALEAPHVCRATFADIQLPSGRRRFHTGMGTVSIGGHDWEGVADPFGGQLVQVGQIQEPRLGEAPSVSIAISGANAEWMKTLWDDDVEGAPASLYWAMFDGETGDVVLDLRLLVEGRLSAPQFRWLSFRTAEIAVTVESKYSSLQYPTPEMEWTTASQRRRYPGDKGLDFLGSDLVEVYRP